MALDMGDFLRFLGQFAILARSLCMKAARARTSIRSDPLRSASNACDKARWATIRAVDAPPLSATATLAIRREKYCDWGCHFFDWGGADSPTHIALLRLRFELLVALQSLRGRRSECISLYAICNVVGASGAHP